MLPEELDARLRWEARRRGVSMADVVREAIEHDLAGTSAGGRMGFFGVGDGQPDDASERVDELVGRAVARRRGGSSA